MNLFNCKLQLQALVIVLRDFTNEYFNDQI